MTPSTPSHTWHPNPRFDNPVAGDMKGESRGHPHQPSTLVMGVHPTRKDTNPPHTSQQ